MKKIAIALILLLTLSACTSRDILISEDTYADTTVKQTFNKQECKLTINIITDEEYAIHTHYCNNIQDTQYQTVYYFISGDTIRITYNKQTGEWD